MPSVCLGCAEYHRDHYRDRSINSALQGGKMWLDRESQEFTENHTMWQATSSVSELFRIGCLFPHRRSGQEMGVRTALTSLGHSKVSGDIFDRHSWGKTRGMNLASGPGCGGVCPGLQCSVPPCTDSPQQPSVWSRLLMVLRSRNPALPQQSGART